MHNANDTIFISRFNEVLVELIVDNNTLQYVAMILDVALHECTAQKADDFEQWVSEFLEKQNKEFGS